jgi:putative peptidoglycan lipid II flippase
MYPMISKMAANNNIKSMKNKIIEALTGVSLLIVPATVGTMIFAEPVVKLLFGRGAFDTNAVGMTSNVLFYYSIGMIGIGFREILSRAFFSLKDTKTPMINAAIGMVLNIVLNIIFSKFLGIGGLALATSISAIFTGILMLITLRNKIGKLGMKKVIITLIKIFAASLVMGLIAKLTFNFFIIKVAVELSLLISILLGALFYFLFIYLLKVEEVYNLVKLIRSKFLRV